MRARNLITVINGATWLQLMLLLFVHCHLESVNGYPQTPSTDPCEASPCGKGAECKSMGSIAICVCPNNNKGDPFVACMQGADEPDLIKPSSSSAPSSASVHHQARASPAAVTTPKPSSTPSTQRVSLITSSTTPGPSSSTSTTRSPYVHVFHTTTERSSSSSSGNFGYSHDTQNPSSSQGNRHGDANNIIPESHRIPIIPQSPSPGGNYPQHEYPPRPISGSSVPSSPYNHGGSYIGSSNSGYDIFNEKSVGSGEYGVTSSYPYRTPISNSGHYSGGQGAYEYDSRPPISYPHHHSSGHQVNRYGQHSYHPSSSGFPAPITESSSSRYSHTGPTITGGSTYDIYNFNPVRNDIVGSHSSDSSYSRIADPLGKYENCRTVNGLVVCADNSNSFPYNHPQYHHSPPRGDYMTTPTSSYGFNSYRDRDHYSSYYPSRHTSVSPYDYSYDRPRQGYPEHGSRIPIETTESYRYPFRHMEQKLSAQTVINLSPTASGHPMCQSMCGVNSVCRLVLDRPVCGCSEGHTGDPSVRCDPVASIIGRGMRRESSVECEKHVECKQTEICAKNKCIDPCQHQEQIMGGSSSVRIASDNQYKTSICGSKAECLVVQHTPVCKCNDGYFGNPYVACVP